MQGQLNSDLNERGKQQALVHGQLLARVGVESIYASPLDRSRQTVDIVRQFVDLAIRYDDRIKEWDCGDWSGHLRADVKRRWPDQWASLETDPFYYRGPGCENYPDMIERASPFLQELLAAPEQSIAVISHGMIGRAMIGVLMRFDVSQMLAFRQPNDVIYRIMLSASGDSAENSRLDRYVAGSGPHEGVTER